MKLRKSVVLMCYVTGVSVASATDWGKGLLGLYDGKAVSRTGYIYTPGVYDLKLFKHYKDMTVFDVINMYATKRLAYKTSSVLKNKESFAMVRRTIKLLLSEQMCINTQLNLDQFMIN